MAEIKTLCDLYFNNVENLKRPDLLTMKKKGLWEVLSTEEVAATVETFSCGLMALGVKPGDKVVIISEDRPKWLITDYAILTAGAVTVPIYPTLNAPDSAYIVNDSDAEVAVVSNENHANKLLSQKASLPRLRDIVIMDPPIEGEKELVPWERVMEWGKDYARRNPGVHKSVASGVKTETLASIVYTSGTTGKQKGVQLEHKCFVENCRAGLDYLYVDKNDKAFVFLPLSHVFERMIDYCYFWRGANITYVENIEALLDNIAETKPTIMATVPRVFEKLYAGIMEKASKASPVKKRLVYWSLKSASDWAEAVKAGKVGLGLRLCHFLADRLVLSKIRELLGGRFRFIVSGGAPLPRHLAVLFYGCGLPIAEGYGLTETAPVISVSRMGKGGKDFIRFGSPGRPLTNVEVRIAEDGELSVRGPNVMSGYYKLPEETAEVLSEAGWLATGDIARQDEDGYIYITDRKKEILVTAGGKNVAPQPIENEVKRSKYVTQVVLIGDKRPYIAALIVPNWDNVIVYAREKGVNEVDPRELKKNPVVHELFKGVVERVNKDLSRYEQIKRCTLLTKEFSQEDGELTPTLKTKRRVIAVKYADEIESLYSAEGYDREDICR